MIIRLRFQLLSTKSVAYWNHLNIISSLNFHHFLDFSHHYYTLSHRSSFLKPCKFCVKNYLPKITYTKSFIIVTCRSRWILTQILVWVLVLLTPHTLRGNKRLIIGIIEVSGEKGHFSQASPKWLDREKERNLVFNCD